MHHKGFIVEANRYITSEGIMYDYCEFCSKKIENRLTDTHHLIPRIIGGKDEDTLEVCRSCHTKLDNRIKNFILYGSFQTPPTKTIRVKINITRRKYEKTEKAKEYKRKYKKENREKILGWNRKYHQTHKKEAHDYNQRPEIKKRKREYMRKWRERKKKGENNN